MKLRKAWKLSPFTEVTEERKCSESKSRVLDLEDIC
jgi:hypothetical protein